MKFDSQYNPDLVYRSVRIAYENLSCLDMRKGYMALIRGGHSEARDALEHSLPGAIQAALAYANLLAAIYRDLTWQEGNRVTVEQGSFRTSPEGEDVSLFEEIHEFARQEQEAMTLRHPWLVGTKT